MAIGAISEADRHNIGGEHISADNSPLIGEQPVADAMRGVAWLPRGPEAGAGRFTGSLTGGEIEQAVQEGRVEHRVCS